MDPGIVNNGDGVDGAAVAQRLREEMERDRARADASRIRKAADRFSQALVEVDRAADAEADTRTQRSRTQRRKKSLRPSLHRTRTHCMRRDWRRGWRLE